MADKHSNGTHNPSEGATQRWDNDGGAIKGVRAKRPHDPNQLGKLIVDIATGEAEDRPPTPGTRQGPAAAALGRKGGAARAAGMSAKKRKEIAIRAAAKRWKR